jgi:hypothetical protein
VLLPVFVDELVISLSLSVRVRAGRDRGRKGGGTAKNWTPRIAKMEVVSSNTMNAFATPCGSTRAERLRPATLPLILPHTADMVAIYLCITHRKRRRERVQQLLERGDPPE